ncbi:MAG: glycoside hydrolase family 3 protein [Abditibacteriota bacterium]|nr:glycoside hydrolase family 3 protein [Abditibacteriota bacterium]
MKNKDVIKQLTLDEKLSMLTGAGGMSSVGVERLGIKPVVMCDGPNGPHRNEDLQICYPSSSLTANSFDPELMEEAARGMGADCIEQGSDMLLAPGVSLKRTPLCGRNFEYFSEDPLLAGKMGAAFIRGVQSKGVATSLKHFACNNIEFNRGAISANVDERTLREIYLKAFEIAVKEGKPWTVMCSYNKINAVWSSENKWLLDDVLRGDWGYDGLVVSDWGAVHNRAECFKARLDLQMPQDKKTPEIIKKDLEEGRITEEDIDRCVDALITLAQRVKDRPEKNEAYSRAAQHELCAQTAAAGMVLLKNDGVLPLDPAKVKKVAVIGPAAVKPVYCGSGSAFVKVKDENLDSPLEKLRELSPDIQFDYFDDVFCGSEPVFDHAVWAQMNGKLADYDAFLFFVSDFDTTDGEAYDRLSINFDSRIEAMLMHFCGHKNTVVVMQSGSAMAPVWGWDKSAAAIVQMGLAGEAGGTAVARLLLGLENFSGKLSETYPLNLDSAFFNKTVFADSGKTEYKEGVFVGYRWYDSFGIPGWFPFGHGLSYTTFEYSDIDVSEGQVSFKIRNTGSRKGSETAQIYVRPVDSTKPAPSFAGFGAPSFDIVSTQINRPFQELRDFVKVTLEPGEETTVTAAFDDSWFSYWSPEKKAFVKDACSHEICVGASSRDIRLKAFVKP